MAICDFSQEVIELDLSTSSETQGYAGGLRVDATLWDSYMAAFSGEAIITARVGGLSAQPYNLYSFPVRQARAPFGEVWLSWDAQAGITATIIFGIGENAGVR